MPETALSALEKLCRLLEGNLHLKKEAPYLQEALAQAKGGTPDAVLLDENDRFGQLVNQAVAEANPDRKTLLYAVLRGVQKASGGVPSQKYGQETSRLAQQLGEAEYVSTLNQWLGFARQVEARRESPYLIEFFRETNAVVLKGLIWSLQPYAAFHPTLRASLTGLAEKAYQKIPGKGPAAAGVGNACLYTLAQAGLEGIAQLSRLKLRIRQASTQELIQKYIAEASARMGMSPDELEDLAVPDFGLQAGEKTVEFGEYQARIRAVAVGNVSLTWHKADGTALKSEPAVVKRNFAVELKALKAEVSEIQKTLAAQRDRLDRSFVTSRVLTAATFENHYVRHGLMSVLTRQLVWEFEAGGQRRNACWLEGRWVDTHDAPLDVQPERVACWHPVGHPVEEITAWREFLNRHEIRQPLKQAYREIYLLTEAELRTRLYSNRMAAHVLKQHQFNSLAKLRSWRYSLLGAYDKGYESEIARLRLPDQRMVAEFWVSEVADDHSFNDTGIWLYVTTDQVRFTRPDDPTPVPLVDVPARVFSEVMRDVDLFVGVGSVGNDPTWRDNGGLPQYRDYWQSYAFGDLNELAKTRRAALERLVPRLKIAPVAELRERFLVVKGHLRTYKIHIGSGNILMEPNDQYLCIVPDRRTAAPGQAVFLPFEGDAVLSIILSKAFLLADDARITDETITRQLTLG